MIKIAIVKNIPIYLDQTICFIKHSKNEIFVGRFFHKLSIKSQNILMEKNTNEIKNTYINLSSIETKECLQEMYKVLKDNKDNDPLVFEDMKNISKEYISLQKKIKN